jgi:hypothetical protein
MARKDAEITNITSEDWPPLTLSEGERIITLFLEKPDSYLFCIQEAMQAVCSYRGLAVLEDINIHMAVYGDYKPGYFHPLLWKDAFIRAGKYLMGMEYTTP